MLKQAYYMESTSINPYHNLALEERLFDQHQPDSIIFYLWQNQHTVVIGRNQNAYKECHLEQMETDHCYLARRSTGGGAVYHDLGNLNFTFIAGDADYDIARQSEVIIATLRKRGILARLSGRNDIEVAGRKVSGNAFLHQHGKRLQHGTLLVDVDKTALSRYLNVSSAKLKTRGVASVQSRVENLRTFDPSLNIADLKTALCQTFSEVYGLPLEVLPPQTGLIELIARYQAYDYLYNRIPDHTFHFSDRFTFGEADIYADVINGYLMNLTVYSDTLALDFIQRLPRIMARTYLDDQALEARLRDFPAEDEIYFADIRKIWNLIKEKKHGL